MLPISRINDVGIGYCPPCERVVTGRIVTGNVTVIVEGSPVSYHNCTFQGDCGHTSSLISSAENITNSMSIARINDPINGTITGSITTGALTVFSS